MKKESDLPKKFKDTLDPTDKCNYKTLERIYFRR